MNTPWSRCCACEVPAGTIGEVTLECEQRPVIGRSCRDAEPSAVASVAPPLLWTMARISQGENILVPSSPKTPSQHNQVEVTEQSDNAVMSIPMESNSVTKLHVRGANGKCVTVFKVRDSAIDGTALRTLNALHQLDVDGNGEIDLNDLLKTVAKQESLNETVLRQRKLIVGMIIALVVLFGITLGTSSLSSVLTREMTVAEGRLVSTDGDPVRTQSDEMRLDPNGVLEVRTSNNSNVLTAPKHVHVVPHSPTVSGLRIDVNSSDGGDSWGLSSQLFQCTLPLAEASSISQQFVLGSTSFVAKLPCLGRSVYAKILESSTMDGVLTLGGTTLGGSQAWEVVCNPPNPTCHVLAVELENHPYRRALRELKERRLAGSETRGDEHDEEEGERVKDALLNRRSTPADPAFQRQLDARLLKGKGAIRC